jgi:hypothetical protein
MDINILGNDYYYDKNKTVLQKGCMSKDKINTTFSEFSITKTLYNFIKGYQSTQASCYLEGSAWK